MDHVEEALKGIINKNSGELLIKKNRELRVSEPSDLSKQANEIRRIVGEFVPEALRLDGKTAILIQSDMLLIT